MVIQHNLSAMGSNRFLGINTGTQAKYTERLSSGYRINRAADDAAGLAISEKMRRQIRGLTRASENAQDGISLVQSAEGALQEVHEMLQRGNELAVQAANGTMSDYDRELIDLEIQQLKDQIDQTAMHTVFNEVRLFPDGGDAPAVTGNYRYEISINLKDGTHTVTNASGVQAMGRSTDATSSGSALADLIANELVPNAVENIMTTFSAFRGMQNGEEVMIGLDIGTIDGKGNTAAFAQVTYTGAGRPVDLKIKVDSADYSDSDVTGFDQDKLNELESTIAHELMHTVMQYNLTDGMTGRTGDKYPQWFTEGTAQLAGGGADWNAKLIGIASSLTSASDTSQDAAIADYLNDYTMAGRPYGHGYLAAAYLGYKANTSLSGTGNLTNDWVTVGMNRIFSQLETSSFDDVILSTTGLTEADLNNMFKNGDADLVTFVRKLAYATQDGAGSFITGSVSDVNILPTTASLDQPFQVDKDRIHILGGQMAASKSLSLQVGADQYQTIEVDLFQMDSEALGIKDTDVKTAENAQNAIGSFKDALAGVSQVRSYYGAVQNRLEHTIANLDNVVENTTAAESRIRDTDMAKTMVEYSNHRILTQAGQSMLAQANRQSESVLGLLG